MRKVVSLLLEVRRQLQMTTCGGRSGPSRPLRFGPVGAILEPLPGGAALVRNPDPLAAYPRRYTERLLHWAARSPSRTFLAERASDGTRRELSYAGALREVRSIAAALLTRDLSPDRPLAILSENGIDHALLGLAALHVGIPYAPISPACSLLSSDFGKLKHVLALLRPGLVFAGDGERYGRAIAAAVPAGDLHPTHPAARRSTFLDANEITDKGSLNAGRSSSGAQRRLPGSMRPLRPIASLRAEPPSTNAGAPKARQPRRRAPDDYLEKVLFREPEPVEQRRR